MADFQILSETIAKAPRWVPVQLPDFQLLAEEKMAAVMEAEKRVQEMTQRCNILLSKTGDVVENNEILSRGSFRFHGGQRKNTSEDAGLLATQTTLIIYDFLSAMCYR